MSVTAIHMRRDAQGAIRLDTYPLLRLAGAVVFPCEIVPGLIVEGLAGTSLAATPRRSRLAFQCDIGYLQ